MEEIITTVRTLLGAIYVLLVPGLALSFAFFARGAVDWIERVALSFALSIAVVPLVAFYLNLLKVKINAVDVVLEVAAITVLALAVAWRRGSWQPVVAEADTAEVVPSEPALRVPPAVRKVGRAGKKVARRVKRRLVRL